MTRKELATELYRLNVIRGICHKDGCGEKEWVRRALNGIGSSKRMSKEQLQNAVQWAKESLAKE